MNGSGVQFLVEQIRYTHFQRQFITSTFISLWNCYHIQLY
jgi:hypothetical protein